VNESKSVKSGKHGGRRMAHHKKSMFQEMFQEMSVHFYSSGREEGHMIMLGNGKWLQLFQLWDHTVLQHVRVDTPCDGPLIKKKRAYHHIMHQHTPELSLLTIINVLISHIQVFNTPHLNIMAVIMPRHLESGTFIREKHPF
jgi:hypothetical protein